MKLARSALAVALVVAPGVAQPAQLAIVGATIIDGNGGEPIENGVVVIGDGKITWVGAAERASIPTGAERVEGNGRFLLPGFIDTNVHLSLYGGHTAERYETLVKYEERQEEVILEAAQLQLKYGVTTVRDSYGVLPPLIAVRDAIERGDRVGARMLVAGNIVGWGGPFSTSFSLRSVGGPSVFKERMNDLISQGAGEELMDMSQGELRVAIDAYLDKGPDFIKYGGTGHFMAPTFLGFSLEAQKVIVDATHERGRIAETHATSIEGLRLAIEAGVDLVQHPEILVEREIPDALVKLFADRGVICSMLVNTMSGEAWQRHLDEKPAADEDEPKWQTGHQGEAAVREPTSAELRERGEELGEELDLFRKNAEKLIAGGCVTTIGTDNYRAAAPEFARKPKPETQDHGIGSILAIEGLVELGMTPSDAIVAATRNGALASGMLDRLGTIEIGKAADLVLLDANPLEDISNIRRLSMVIKDGRAVALDTLPERPVYYRAPEP